MSSKKGLPGDGCDGEHRDTGARQSPPLLRATSVTVGSWFCRLCLKLELVCTEGKVISGGELSLVGSYVFKALCKAACLRGVF